MWYNKGVRYLRKKRSDTINTQINFFDIDGTLVPLKESIRPRTVEALQKLRQNGIRICIATGRAPMEVPKFEGVTFDALLTYNGSYCFTPERDIFKNLIPKGDIATLRRNAAALGRPLALATDRRLVANGTEPDLEEYFAIGGVKLGMLLNVLCVSFMAALVFCPLFTKKLVLRMMEWFSPLFPRERWNAMKGKAEFFLSP